MLTRYSDSDLQEFKEIIIGKMTTAKKELAYLQAMIQGNEEGGAVTNDGNKGMEDGGMNMEKEQYIQMASRQISFIESLEKARVRVENKTYGICQVTGKLIDKARLRAVPHTTQSMEAKQTNRI